MIQIEEELWVHKGNGYDIFSDHNLPEKDLEVIPYWYMDGKHVSGHIHTEVGGVTSRALWWIVEKQNITVFDGDTPIGVIVDETRTATSSEGGERPD